MSRKPEDVSRCSLNFVMILSESVCILARYRRKGYGGNMLTKKDRIIVREICTEELDKRFEEVAQYFDNLINKLFKEFRNETAQFKDDILFQLVPLSQAYEVLAHQVKEHSDQLKSHEKRITTLEMA